MDSNGLLIQLDSIGFHWIQFNSNGFHWIPLDSNGFQWIPMDSIGFQWIPRDSNGSQWIPMDYWFHWIPFDSIGFNLIPMDSNAFNLMESIGIHWNPMESNGVHQWNPLAAGRRVLLVCSIRTYCLIVIRLLFVVFGVKEILSRESYGLLNGNTKKNFKGYHGFRARRPPTRRM